MVIESTIGQGDGLSFEVREIRGQSITTLKRRGRYVVSRNSTLGHLKKGMKMSPNVRSRGLGGQNLVNFGPISC